MFRTQNLYPGSKNIFELRQFHAWIRNVKQKYGWTAISLVIYICFTKLILGDRGATSRDDAIFSGESLL